MRDGLLANAVNRLRVCRAKCFRQCSRPRTIDYYPGILASGSKHDRFLIFRVELYSIGKPLNAQDLRERPCVAAHRSDEDNALVCNDEAALVVHACVGFANGRRCVAAGVPIKAPRDSERRPAAMSYATGAGMRSKNLGLRCVVRYFTICKTEFRHRHWNHRVLGNVRKMCLCDCPYLLSLFG